MNKGLKRFLVAAAVILAAFVLVDWSVGKVMDKVLPCISRQGQNGMTYYSLNEVNTPIVIVGSSRASHHYIPSMIKDSLGMDVYNIGRDGCFFSYNCCVINSILDRYSPKIIIWETSLDALQDDDDPLESLHPYYGENRWVTASIDEDYDWTERLPLTSNIYKYNSNFIRIAQRYLQRELFVDDDLNGYIPLPVRDWTPTEQKNGTSDEEIEVDETKAGRFKAVLEHALSDSCRLIVINSPTYMASGQVSKSEKRMKAISDSIGVECHNFAQAEGIYDRIEYFSDYTHLNECGAEEFSRRVIEVVKNFE